MVNSVVSVIPLYWMQSAILPVTVCEEVEKSARTFLWGSTGEKRKVHPIAWEDVYREEKKGGLGIKNLQAQNQAFLMKRG